MKIKIAILSLLMFLGACSKNDIHSYTSENAPDEPPFELDELLNSACSEWTYIIRKEPINSQAHPPSTLSTRSTSYKDYKNLKDFKLSVGIRDSYLYLASELSEEYILRLPYTFNYSVSVEVDERVWSLGINTENGVTWKYVLELHVEK